MKQKEIELYRRDDGFWAGREKKDGSLSADAHKVTAEEIMTMFTEFFCDYCAETGQTKLLMQDAQGGLFVTMRVEPQKGDFNKKRERVLNKKPPKATNKKPKK